MSGEGDCYESNGAALLLPPFAGGRDLPEGTRLVHGRPRLRVEPFERFGHAWLESPDGQVHDYSNGRLLRMPRPLYYGLGDIEPEHCKRYSAEQARRLVAELGHWGPW